MMESLKNFVYLRDLRGKRIFLLFFTRLCIFSYQRRNTPKNAKLPRIALFSRRSEEHTSELQSRLHLVCRLLLENTNDRTRPQRRTRAPHTKPRATVARLAH